MTNESMPPNSEHVEPLALVAGSPLAEAPQDLYIPPDALKVFLEAFEGPLDLLLYLIKRQNLDILELPIAQIAEQYAKYIEMMEELRLELAAEYLLMSAMLAEIKSRMLLPRQPDEQPEEDPRAELVKRLLEYQRFKQVADAINMLPRMERDLNAIEVEVPDKVVVKPLPTVDIDAVIIAFQDVLKRMELRRSHRITREPLSVRERISIILTLVSDGRMVSLNDCFSTDEGRGGVIVSLLALLEMLRSGVVEAVQSAPYSTIYIRAV